MIPDDPLPETVDEDVLEAAFRRRALALHPDQNPDPFAAQAFRTLLDDRAERREELARRRPVEIEAFRAVIEQVVGANGDDVARRLARLINGDASSPVRIRGCDHRGANEGSLSGL